MLSGFMLAPVLVAAAQATPADYCAAYARDFADTGTKDEAVWRGHYDAAEKQCLEQYAGLADGPAAAPAPAKPKPPAPRRVQAVAVVDNAMPAAAKPAAKPDLEPGSDAWNDYCARKYTSFNRATGTYQSHTGVERKCLVTADFH